VGLGLDAPLILYLYLYALTGRLLPLTSKRNSKRKFLTRNGVFGMVWG